jgi:hypothetical protein
MAFDGVALTAADRDRSAAFYADRFDPDRRADGYRVLEQHQDQHEHRQPHHEQEADDAVEHSTSTRPRRRPAAPSGGA